MTANAASRRAGARRLFEETSADPDLIAQTLGLTRRGLDALTKREGWVRTGDASEGLGETIDRLLAQLSAQLRLFESQVDEGAGLSKTHLDALLAITRTFDRLSEMKRAEAARASAMPDEAALERARDTIERRIGELSEQRVETMIEHLNPES